MEIKEFWFFPTKAQIKMTSDEPNWDGMQPKWHTILILS